MGKLHKERLQAISLDERWDYQTREFAREILELRAAVEWKPITPESLPKVGDEVGHWYMSAYGDIWDVVTVEGGVYYPAWDYVLTEHMTAEDWTEWGETHYRPTNPPPMPTEGGKKER